MKSKKLLITILALSASILVAIIVYFTPFEKEEIILSESTTTKEIQTTKSDVYEYKEGFTSEPLPADIIKKITGKSYPVGCDYSLDNLSYLKVLYYDFNKEIQSGELIVNKSIAKATLKVFYELYEAKYEIEKIKLIDEYDANDDLSMADNNSSAFNYRFIDGTTTVSDHSYGLAIDINPLYNPYVRSTFGDRNVLPTNGKEYADRAKDFPHKIEKGDVCYNAFINNGFTWGGEWNDPIDYQHFYIEK